MKKAVEEYWGERCDQKEYGCPICDAWNELDVDFSYIKEAIYVIYSKDKAGYESAIKEFNEMLEGFKIK